jgi:hypothetical protein
LGIARVAVCAPAALLEVSGSGHVSQALRRADEKLQKAHDTSADAMISMHNRASTSMTNARGVAGNSMGTTRSRLKKLANDPLYMRMLLSSDTTDFVLATQELVQEFAAPLGEVRKSDLRDAAKAWAWLQYAAMINSEVITGPEVKLPEDTERWMRFTVAAFGADRAGKHGVSSRHERQAAKKSLRKVSVGRREIREAAARARKEAREAAAISKKGSPRHSSCHQKGGGHHC